MSRPNSSARLRRRRGPEQKEEESKLLPRNLVSAFLEIDEDSSGSTSSPYAYKRKSLNAEMLSFAEKVPLYDEGSSAKGSAIAPANSTTNASSGLGTFYGVFLPCTQNILGIILFLRVPWIVGQAGILLSLALVTLCVGVTTLTSLSLSALCTNGSIPSGGPYYVVSRNLGPGIGAAVGLLFYFGTVFAGSMYALGAVEAMMTGFGIAQIFPFDTQISGALIVIGAGAVVRIGMGFVNKFGLIFFGAVMLCVVLLLLGATLFAADAFQPEDGDVAHGSNLFPNFQEDEDLGITPDFFVLLSILFPGHTGIFAGCNRSGSLQSPSVSIPRGTLSAIGFTTALFVVVILLYGLSIAGETLRADKFVAATVAWPHASIVVLGVVFGSIGATLQCLVGSPRLLKAIAIDDLVPALSIFDSKTDPAREHNALYFTVAIAALPCFAGSLDAITPIVTMFFLVTYASVNASCMLLATLREPGWRPSFSYFSRWSAMCGLLLCTVMMFAISYYMALSTLVVAFSVYKYVGYRGVRKFWGDAMCAVRLSEARRTLLSLAANDSTIHKKNWRPQILVFAKACDAKDTTVATARSHALLSLAAQLKKGQGLCMIRALVPGDPLNAHDRDVTALRNAALREATQRLGIRGFARVTMYRGNFDEAALSTLQEAGLASLSPNTVMCNWPRWAKNVRLEGDSVDSFARKKMDRYVGMLKCAIAFRKAVVIAKNPEAIPESTERLDGGYVDVWWLVHDGGLLLLISHLLARHKVWTRCKIRLFAIAKDAPETVVLTDRIKAVLMKLRLDAAELHVLSVGSDKIEALENNRTVLIPKATPKSNRALPGGWIPGQEEEEEEKEDEETAVAAASKIEVIVDNPVSDLLRTNRTPMSDRNHAKRPCSSLATKSFLAAAEHLNQLVQTHSGGPSTRLVIINLPLTRRLKAKDFVVYTEALTHGISRVLLVRGSGEEVVTSIA